MRKKHNMKIALLQLKNRVKYEQNLKKVLKYIDKCRDEKLIVAPEVCLTDYDYDNIDEAVAFSNMALEKLKERIGDQILVLTLLTKSKKSYTNDAIVIHNHKVVHRQSKHKLFLLGEEDKHLTAGRVDDIKLFEIDGIKYGLMICFELRFKELWQRLEGADVILLPSQWGIARKRHLETLSEALAVMNQCFVVVANSAKETMASSSAIYSPSGGVVMDDMQECIKGELDFKLLEKMRRYIVMR